MILAGTPEAIIAGPQHRGRQAGSTGTSGNDWVVHSGSKRGIIKGGYLAAGVLPQIRLESPGYVGTDAQAGNAGTPPTVYEKPTLRGFLAYLEMEQAEIEAEENAHKTGADEAADGDNEQEDEHTSSSGDPHEHGGTGLSGNGRNSEGAAVADGSRIVLQTTDPYSEKAQLFPRPYGQRIRGEDFYMYFPVDDPSGGTMRIVSPGNLDAVFLPPAGMGMRSTATLKEVP